MPHSLAWHHPMSLQTSCFSNGAAFIAALDNISDLLLGNIAHILLAWQYICCYRDFLPPLEKQRFHPPSLFLLPLLAKASISNANNYKNQTMSAATAQLSCSFKRLRASSFPVGNYLFPVVIIILQHAADPISNTSHFHLQPAGCPQLPAVPSVPPQPPSPGAGVKGTDLFQLEMERKTTERR